MPLNHILKNKLLLQKNFHVQEESMNDWPFWMFEENIKIVNSIIEEENKNQKAQEKEQQKSMPNFDPNSIMRDASNIGSNLPNIPKF
jgi:hypothetical protein